MATNTARWIRNLLGASEPLILLGSFQAGSTQAIKAGELLEFTGDSNTDWVPMDSDFAMKGNVAIAACEIKDGDRAGYYPIIVPRPGDVFEFAIDTAAAVAVGTPVYYSSSEEVSASGTYVLGYAVGQEHYPPEQQHLADGGLADMGTTIRNTSHVRMCINQAASLLAEIVRQDKLNLGDAGGFSGPIYDASGTSVQIEQDGTLTHSLEADGTVTDEVS